MAAGDKFRSSKGAHDPISGMKGRITTEHWHIHAGLAFEAGYLREGANSYDIIIDTNEALHLKEVITTVNDSEVKAAIYRNPTYNEEGENNENIPLDNSNELSDIELDAEFIFTEEVTNVGELVGGTRNYLPGTDTAGGQGEGETADWEIVLDPDNTYLYRVEKAEGTSEFRCHSRFKMYIVGDK